MSKSRTEQLEELRIKAENDLFVFASLVNPSRVYGGVHKELFNWWTRRDAKDNQLCLLPRDHQKVLRRDEPVLMSDGSWKKTEDICEGDVIADPATGGSQTVTHLHPWGLDDYYEITLDDGRKIQCGAGHLWEIEQHGFKEGPIVRDTLWLIDHHKRERFEKRTGNHFTEWKSAIRATEPLQFSEAEVLIPPYVLGAWLGDGSSSQGVITSETDEIPGYIADHGYEVNKHKSKYGYGISGLLTQLKQVDVVGNKHIPANYFQGSIAQRMNLLRGLLDTDGNVNKKNGIVSFSQCDARKGLVEQVASLVRSLGGKAKLHQAMTSCDGKEFKSWTLNIWLPKKVGNPFLLKRKAALYNEVARFKPQMLKSWIHSIVPVERQYSRCITVSNPRGLYVTRDYLVTHNSHCAAVYAAWLITKNPWATILYVSATADLAEKQLYAIKNIIDSKVYRRYWPEMIDQDEGKREKWSAMEIAVDHPKRAQEGVRDPTVKAAGLTTNITGFHANYVFLDDVVVPGNAYKEEGRKKVEAMYSQLSSIKTTGGKTVAVGTRYHPRDLYSTILDRKLDVYEGGELARTEMLYELFQKVVEEDGQFLWPKTVRSDGRAFGFDENELAKKRSEYLDTTQFYAQYYNNPNDPNAERISSKNFQYFDKKFLKQEGGWWYYHGRKLNVFAGIDFAFSLRKKADFTAIAVVGVDSEHQFYILDIDRFKTDSIKDYYEHILTLHQKWEFRKLRAEVTVAQQQIVNELKTSYIIPNGLMLSVDEYRPTRHEGTKEERMMAVLGPRYANQQIWHYRGGNCEYLEEEITLTNPPHDDVSDAVTAAIDVSVAPTRSRRSGGGAPAKVVSHPRFGGVRFA